MSTEPGATAGGDRAGSPLENPPIPALLPRDWPGQVAAIVDDQEPNNWAKVQRLHSLLDAWVLAATRHDETPGGTGDAGH